MNSRIQEIKVRLETMADSPERADLMIELASGYQNSDPLQALALVEKADEFCRQLGYRQGLALATRIQGSIHEQLGDYAQAVKKGTEALNLYQELGDRREQGRCLNNIGLAYTRIGALGVALDYLQRAMEVLPGQGDEQIRAYVINNIGLTHHALDNHQKALEHFQQSLEMLERLGDGRNVARALSNIGLCHRNLGHLSLAMEYMKKSLALRQELGDRFSQVHNWINISSILRDQKEYQQCYDCLMKAMDLAIEGGHAVMEIYIMVLLAKLKNLTGDLDSAREYIEQALPLAERHAEGNVLRSLYHEYAENFEARREMTMALEYRIKYFRSHLELLEANLAHLEAGGGGLQGLSLEIYREQLSNLELKANNIHHEFLHLVEHIFSVIDPEKKASIVSPGRTDEESLLDGFLNTLPQDSRPAVFRIWTDLQDIRARLKKLKQ